VMATSFWGGAGLCGVERIGLPQRQPAKKLAGAGSAQRGEEETRRTQRREKKAENGKLKKGNGKEGAVRSPAKGAG